MIRRVALVALLSVLSVRIVDASSFGRTPGKFGVSPIGSAQYSIPIWAPPGPNGMQPNVALQYDSRSGIGPLGVGWSLVGLGSITRCNLTTAQDSIPANVALVTTDGYCLNGNRLRLTSGTYGAAGSTYQTEIADFSNITASGTAGNGPAYFTVQARNGNTYQYGFTDTNGNGANSQVLASGTSTALTWLLSKVIDRAGNNYVINYTALTGTAVPNYILWTPTSAGASTYTYKMLFNYGPNVPQSSFFEFVAGTTVSNLDLLTSIEIFNGTTVIKDYLLGYVASPLSGREELNTITECADSAGSNCLLPTVVSYQGGVPGVINAPVTVPSSSGAVAARYDFNGDGYPDLVYNNGSTWLVAFGSVSGYGTPFNTGIAVGSVPALFGNVTGGREDGILTVVGSTWTYYLWNGSGFTGTSITGFTYDATSKNYILADINGDGLPDLFSQKDTTTIVGGHSILTSVVSYHLNTSSSTTASFNATLITAYSTGGGGILSVFLQGPDAQNGKLRRYDFNGDGRDDLIVQIESGTAPNLTLKTYELISTGTAFTVSAPIATIPASTTFIPIFFTNWNDDKCTDFVTSNTLYISGCNGSAPQTYSLPGTILLGMDWDGDGRTDILVQSGSTIGVYLSPGNSTVAPSISPTSIPYNASCTYVWMDANGDGLDDLGCFTATSVSYFPHNGTSDLATSFADGYGITYSPSYVPLSASGGIYTEGTSAVFPNQDYSGPMYVVSSYSSSDGIGGTFNSSYTYAGAILNLQGRGFQGFTTVSSTDSRTLFKDSRTYSTGTISAGIVIPTNGLLLGESVTQSAGTSVSIGTYAPAWLTLDSTTNNQRYFPYTSSSSVNTYEVQVGGSYNGQLITTTAMSYGTPDAYGNFPSVAKTITDEDSGSPYMGQQWTSTVATTITPNPSTWCNSLPTERDTTNTAPGVPSITRHLSFTPDYSNCRETQQVVESGNSTYQVTTGYGFDAFGNINSQSVTGIGMAARTTSINWGTTGQFPTTVTNALSQTTQTSFDPNFGNLLSMQDPNGITVSWQYDPFGRKNKEIRPDGTYTVWSYNDCVVWGGGGCLHGPHALALAHYNYSTTGADLSDGTNWFDQFDRPIITNAVSIAGTYNRTDIRYDNLGNISQQSMPCAWVAVLTSCTYWTTLTHDPLNRLTQSQRPISATNGTLQTTTIQYSGRTTTTTDPQSKVTTNITKVTGKVGRTKDHNGYYVNFNHDAFGSVLSVTDSLSNTLRTMTYAYGLKAFRTSLSDIDLGTRSYTPDALGEVTSYFDGKGQHFSAVFDALSRMTSRTEPDPSGTFTSTWTWGATAASHNIGKLASVQSVATGGTYIESYTYDGIGRLSNETITLPTDGTPAFDYAYDATTGFLSTLTYPPSFPTTYRLTAGYTYQHGILQKIFDALVPTTIWWQTNSMNPRGQITQETTEDLSGHPQIVSNRTYDAVTGWLGSTQTGPGGGATLQNEAYQYDEMGNVIQRQNNNLGLTENFYYDNLYRLDHSILGASTNLQMAYDSMGNITSRSDIAGGATWTYDPVRKHAVTQAGSSSFTYAYDANGNVTSRNGSIVSWTSYNYPSGVGTTTESATFDYGPNRQRWRMLYTGPSGTEGTFYATPKFEKVYAGGGGEYRSYIYAGNRPVVVVMRNTAGAINVRSLLVDHQGSISSIVTDSTGVSLVGESFTAYGNRREASTWTGAPTSGELTTMNGVTREGYTFQTVLGSMGLNHMNGRIEDSVSGRFLSPDPRGIILGNTQSWNRYSYVMNNPLTLIDPTGFGCISDGDGSSPTTCDTGVNDGGANGPSATSPDFPTAPMIKPIPLVEVLGSTCPAGPVACTSSAPPDSWPTTLSADGLQQITVTSSAIKPKTQPKSQQIPCLPGVDCYIQSTQGQNSGRNQLQQACGNLSSLSCEVCVNDYLQNYYGNFGGFIASTFNIQQSIPGLSGDSALDTLSFDAEIAAVKTGIPWLLQTGGRMVNIFTTPNLAEITGATASTTLGLFGAATAPFASTALFNARIACGG
jgi:RHS repeat-associated protein